MRFTSKFIFTVTVILFSIQVGFSQDKIDREAVKKDHYKESSLLRPDSLIGDQKLIFDLFSTWTLDEIQDVKSETVKTELKKANNTIDDPKRFKKALSFLVDIEYHRISRNQWKEFDDLAPQK